MIAKLIVRAPDREQALARLGRAIDEYVIAGVPTTLPLLRALIGFGPVRDASYGTATLEPFAAEYGTLQRPQGAEGTRPFDQLRMTRLRLNPKPT